MQNPRYNVVQCFPWVVHIIEELFINGFSVYILFMFASFRALFYRHASSEDMFAF